MSKGAAHFAALAAERHGQVLSIHSAFSTDSQAEVPEVSLSWRAQPNTPEQLSAAYDTSILVRRWGSTLIDFLLLGALFVALLALPEALVGYGLGLYLLFLVLYFPLLEFRFGATLGKLICRVRVVGPDGLRPSMGQAAIRSLLRLLEVNPFVLGGIPAGVAVLASKKRQRLGDMAAGTFVLRSEDASYLARLREHTASALVPQANALQPPIPVPPPLPPPLDNTNNWVAPTHRSGWAIAAGYLGLFAVLGLPAPFAVVAGILGLREINRTSGLGGRGRALFGIIMGSVFSFLLLVVVLFAALGPS